MFEEVIEAFNRQAALFDEYEKHNEILKRMRSAVREHLLRHLEKSSNVLELNAGTGLDAVFLAVKGFKIHAVDISPGMLKKLEEKVKEKNLSELVTFEVLSFTELEKFQSKFFDYIFSNFGGLNCTKDLNHVISQFKNILKPGGKATLVIMPPFCPWELKLVFKGQFKPAFRRLHKNGVTANIEGIKFKTYYHSLSKLKKLLKKDFKLIEVQGLAALSPPPYAEKFPKLHPELFKILTGIDKIITCKFPFNRWADHYIVTFELKK